MNNLCITGRLGNDPDSRTVGDQTVCGFSVAVDGRGDTTTWFRVSVWGKQGESCQKYLAKGREVAISGELALREYTDRDGNQRQSLDLNARQVDFIGGRGDSAPAGGPVNQNDPNDIPF